VLSRQFLSSWGNLTLTGGGEVALDNNKESLQERAKAKLNAKPKGNLGSVTANPGLFGCCNNKQLQIFKCTFCNHIMCKCNGCHCAFPDLRNCTQAVLVKDNRFNC